MPIRDTDGWSKCIENNKDGYGSCIVKIAEKVMEYLDKGAKLDPPSETHRLICRADDETRAGGITGFMAGAASSIISGVHSRGDEWRVAWNKDNGVSDPEAKGTVNPAIMTIG